MSSVANSPSITSSSPSFLPLAPQYFGSSRLLIAGLIGMYDVQQQKFLNSKLYYRSEADVINLSSSTKLRNNFKKYVKDNREKRDTMTELRGFANVVSLICGIITVVLKYSGKESKPVCIAFQIIGNEALLIDSILNIYLSNNQIVYSQFEEDALKEESHSDNLSIQNFIDKHRWSAIIGITYSFENIIGISLSIFSTGVFASTSLLTLTGISKIFYDRELLKEEERLFKQGLIKTPQSLPQQSRDPISTESATDEKKGSV